MNLDGKITNPGELRTQIVLLTRTISEDAGKFQKPTWSTVAAVWAKWVNAHGGEAREAGAQGAEQTATVLIRWRSGLDATMAVQKGGTYNASLPVYEVMGGLDDVRERHEYIEMQVRRIGAG